MKTEIVIPVPDGFYWTGEIRRAKPLEYYYWWDENRYKKMFVAQKLLVSIQF